MKALAHHRILLGLTGSIAAYKAIELIRLLREEGAEVQTVMTEAALKFVTPLTLQAISGRPVRHALFDQDAEAAMSHIELARWATYIIIAPASADILAKLAHGFSDDLLSTLCLASLAPLYLAPAMNRVMWEHVATQSNLMTLTQRGARVIGPSEGVQACGEWGFGRMVSPLEILQAITPHPNPAPLEGQHIVITAGPTQEAIDPVRYLSNQSSGKMGYALADAAKKMGAQVTLISGPVHLKAPEGISTISVTNAAEMLKAVLCAVDNRCIFIGAAAVADYRPLDYETQKIKKSEEILTLRLIKNPDILAQVANLPSTKRPVFIMGFAAETKNCLFEGRLKLKNKNVEMIAVNDVSQDDIGFHSDENTLTLLFCDGREQTLEKALKEHLAYTLLKVIQNELH